MIRNSLKLVGRKVKVILAVSGLLLLANSVSFLRNFLLLAQTEPTFRAGLLSGQQIIISGILFFALLAIFSPWPRVFKIWVGFLFFVTATTSYFTINYGVQIKYFIINNVFEASRQETTEFLDTMFLIYLGFGIIAGILFYFFDRLPLVRFSPGLSGWPWITEKSKKPFFDPAVWTGHLILIATIVVIIAGVRMVDDSGFRSFFQKNIGSYSPLNMVKASLTFARKSYRDRTAKIVNIRKEFTRSKALDNEPLTVVLIIGESARGDRFSMNGYGRDTNPKLSKVKNLVSFRQASACNTSTVTSVPCIFSRRLKSEFSIPVRETSLVGILRNLGFATYWYSMQYNSVPMGFQCKEAEICQDGIPGEYDISLMDQLDKSLKSSENQNTLIILQTRGSHTTYYKRTPENMIKFSPICKKSSYACEKSLLDNTYDNSIVYTDFFLDSVVRRLSGLNAFMIYTSDHGQSLGEVSVFGKIYGHALPLFMAPKEQINVPLIFWASDKFVNSENSRVISTAQQMINQPVSHDNVFHSLLDCAGVESPLILKRLSFCR